MRDRAGTLEMKKQILVRLYRVWKHNPELRLGQLLQNVFEKRRKTNHITNDTIHDVDLFYKEDVPFIEELEAWDKGIHQN